MPLASSFRLGVRFTSLYNALPIAQRSKAGSWTQRIPAMGFRLSSVYCAHKDNIHREIMISAPHPNKAFYVCAREIMRKFPDTSDQIAPQIEELARGQGEDTQPETTPATTRQAAPSTSTSASPEPSDPPADAPSDTQSSERFTLSEIQLLDHEHFVGADGSRMDIRSYGERQYDTIRFDLRDMFEAFQANIARNPIPTSIQWTSSRVCLASNDLAERSVVDMWNFVRTVEHYHRLGNENAAIVFEWMIKVIFNAQFGSGETPCQADHAAGVGRTLPTAFGKDVCGSYAYAFLNGSESVLEAFPSLRAKISELGIADKKWSLWKDGHSEHMRGRLHASDVKKMLTIHPECRISHGFFWHAPSKALAAKCETSVRANVLTANRVTLPEHPTLTELFVLAEDQEAWLDDEAQALVNANVTQGLDKSELVMLKAMNKMREECDEKLGEKDAVIRAKEEEIKVLNREKIDIAHAAARLLCPKKKLSALDAMFKPRATESSVTHRQ